MPAAAEPGPGVPPRLGQRVRGAGPRGSRPGRAAGSAGGAPPGALAAGVRGGHLDLGPVRCGDQPGAGVLLLGVPAFGGSADRGRLVVSVDRPAGLGKEFLDRPGRRAAPAPGRGHGRGHRRPGHRAGDPPGPDRGGAAGRVRRRLRPDRVDVGAGRDPGPGAGADPLGPGVLPRPPGPGRRRRRASGPARDPVRLRRPRDVGRAG